MKALVTGGGGFLGLYIVEQLLEAGHQVRVYCRGRYETLERLGVQVLQGDLKDDAGVRNACQDMEAVFHAAAVPGVWGPWHKYYETNTAGTRNVIAGCLRAGTSRLIYTSSPSVVFDGREHIDADETLQYPTRWLCHYPHSKALAEHAVLEANGCGCLRTVSLRPHLIWGPRDNHLIPRLIQKAASGRLRQVGDGGNVVSIAYVENAAAAHLQAEESLRNSATAAGKAYFINEPQSVNLWDWINNLLERAGMPQVTRCISQRNAVLLGRILESVYGTLGLRSEPPMTHFVALQLSGSHSYSIAAAQRDFGYHPLCTMEEGLARLQPELERLARH